MAKAWRGVVVVGLVWGMVSGLLAGETAFPGAAWERRSAESLGLDAGMIDRIGERMQEAQANGALVYRGYLVAEWTFDGPSTRQIEVQSVTKSMTSLMLGLALQEQLIPSLDAKVQDHFPAFDAGPYAEEITFRHLATCTSGLKTTVSPGNYGQTCMVWPEAGLVLTKVNSPRKPPFIGGVQLWPLVLDGIQARAPRRKPVLKNSDPRNT
ncbi:MAG: serine hydrolase domain-containing protein [Thermoguttaceae bacterium]|jgi:CubicO group peptidase (beta-lactamase class C family)|nr:serine hydrolase domain-containing protein [Thermoguttaceae bacterium]